MAVRKATAVWKGDLKRGNGTVRLGSGAFEGSYSFASRFESGDGTNPEELLGAAHAGCFSMWLANSLAGEGHTVESVDTVAHVHLEKVDGLNTITRIDLVTRASVPGLDEETFQEHARSAKEDCIVSRALAATEITLEATLR